MGSSAKDDGSGQPHIMCPIETYISKSRNPADTINRRKSFGVVRSASASSSAAPAADLAPDAPFCCAP